jgi:hypothetical protein
MPEGLLNNEILNQVGDQLKRTGAVLHQRRHYLARRRSQVTHQRRGGGGADAGRAMKPEPKWLNFYYAVQNVRERLGVSDGEARRLLREACAGSVKSQRQLYDRRTGHDLEAHEGLRSKHWREDDMDLVEEEDGSPYFVDVDEEDFRFWLDNLLKSKTKRRGASKDDLARKIIAKLNLPADMSNVEVHQRVGADLKADGIRDIPSLSVIKRIRAKKSVN